MTMDELNDLFDADLQLDLKTDTDAELVDNNTSDDLFSEELIEKEITGNPVLDNLLKAKGITDGKIKIIDEDESETEVNFSDLSVEEQLEILNESTSTEDDNLDESEVELINYMREKNLSVEDFLELYKQEIIASLEESTTQNYEIDAYDDSELFMLDLKNKYNLTDEELEKELEKELKDETLFKKKVDVLRAEYKQLEDEQKEAQKLEFEQNQQQEYDKFAERMVNIAVETPEFYGIELEDEEKNEVLSFLLDIDESGVSEFSKTLNDPKKLYEAAWFLRYGKESFDALKNAYESEIARIKKDSKPAVVHKNPAKNKQGSIHDLF